jgi:hypothetical protein
MLTRPLARCAACALLLWACIALPAGASPWAEVGDNQLRADLELLQAAGVAKEITVQWPLPWQSLSADLSRADLAGQPVAVQQAVQRLLARAHAQTAPGMTAWASLDATNKPGLVYGFDSLGRGEGQAQLALELNSGIFSGRLALGGITRDFGAASNKIMPDGSYLSARLGGVRVYAGYLDHWWGPGQISTLQLSNNARPMPQIGFMRSSTQASSWPILRWLGPWQLEFFIAKFDGPQIQSGVYYDATRLTVNPLPGLELGVAKAEQICGAGHYCNPVGDYFTNFDFSTHPNNVNGEGAFDIKYSRKIASLPFQIYAQLMNEDYAWTTSSGSSYLAGASIFLPTAGSPVKLTMEYADTVATKTPFEFSHNIFGYTYTDTQFPDGMHYRGRTLGFSLDTDSTLLSLQGNWSDAAGRFYELSLHHAAIASKRANVSYVTTAPVIVNMAEARFSLPLTLGSRTTHLDLAGRLQDDQPRPHSGFAAALEVALRMPLN